MATRYRSLLVDQALYAASNLLAVAIAGRTIAPHRFGGFMFVFLAISVLVNAVRAVWSEPELAAGRTHRPVPNSVALAVALIASALVSGSSLVMVTLGASLAAVVQDRLRYEALVRGRLTALIAGDGLWAAILAVGWLVTLTRDVAASAAGVLTLWGAGAIASCLVLRLGSVVESSPSQPAAGYRRRVFAGDFLLQSGSTQLVGLLLGLVLLGDAYGELRAAITLFGPIGVANLALTTKTLPGGAAVLKRLPVAIVAFAVSVALALAALPAGIGETLLGAGWPGRPVLLLIGLTVAVQTLSGFALTTLKVQGRDRALLGVRGTGTALLLVATLWLGKANGSAAAVACGYLAANVALAALAWLALGGTRAVAPTPSRSSSSPDTASASTTGARPTPAAPSPQR